MDIKALDEVWTSDGDKLGVAHSWYYRPDGEVHPGDRLYAAYLGVNNFELGDDFYVPDVYIAGREEESGRVLLAVTSRQIANLTWNRKPNFIAHQRGRAARLPAKSAQAAPALV